MAVTGDQIVAEAKRFVGVPYVWGGASPQGFDCSGLVQYTLDHLGIKAPRTSEQQWRWTQHITRDQLQPGDLVFEDPSSNGPGHVVIYAGGGQIVEAPHTGTDVRVRQLGAHEDIVGYGRPPGMQAATGTATNAQDAGWNPLGNLLKLPQSVTDWFVTAEQFAQGALWLLDPTNWVRIISGAFGMVFLIAGLIYLAGAA